MRHSTFFLLVVFVFLSALACYSQQDYITQYSVYGAYSYLSTPSLNLIQRGLDADVGVNMRPWLTLGFDFSYGNGGSSLLPQYLSSATLAKLAPYKPLLPPGYKLAVPYSGTTYTYEAGPQFNYRRLKKVTFFVRPALGALHVSITPHPGDPIAQKLVSGLLGSGGAQTDTVVFYGFGGGFTWELKPQFGIRVAADLAHYNMFSDLLNGGRNSVRITVGTKFGFGKNVVK